MRREVGPRILFIPDTQCAPGAELAHMEWAGRYAAEKRPDVIVHAGDHYDFGSLSSYDEGKKAMEGRRLSDDLAAGDEGLRLFEDALKKHSPRGYRPRKAVTLGNHENRLQRYIDDHPKLDGALSMGSLAFRRYGWEVSPFLAPLTIHKISFCHYWPVNARGLVTQSRNGCPDAKTQVRRLMRSCVAGHAQGFDYALHHTPFATYRGVIAGSYYVTPQTYLTSVGLNHWRGVLIFNDVNVKTGEFALTEVDLRYLERKYG